MDTRQRRGLWGWALILVGCALLFVGHSSWQSESDTARDRNAVGNGINEATGDPVVYDIQPDHFGSIAEYGLGGLLIVGGLVLRWHSATKATSHLIPEREESRRPEGRRQCHRPSVPWAAPSTLRAAPA